MTTLSIEHLHGGYGRMEILHDLSLHVDAGEIVSLIGANGAGKTTTLRTIAGMARAFDGTIRFDGDDVTNMRPDLVVRRGLVHVAQDRELFGDLSVLDNLMMGAYARSRAERSGSLEEVYSLFPVLEERHSQQADTMSGGQQQMLAIGRALLCSPRLMLLDEPSDGLAPTIVEQVGEILIDLARTGLAVLIVEQDLRLAFDVADRVAVMTKGSIVHESSVAEFRRDGARAQALLGVG